MSVTVAQPSTDLPLTPAHRRTRHRPSGSRPARASADSKFRPPQYLARLPTSAVRGGAGRRRGVDRDSSLSARYGLSQAVSGGSDRRRRSGRSVCPTPGTGNRSRFGANGDRAIHRGEVLRIALVYGVEPLALSELIWRIEELQATRQFAEDVPEPARQRLLASAGCRLG